MSKKLRPKISITFLLFLAPIGLAAQPAFEAASIRVNDQANRPDHPIAEITSGALTMRNQALLYLIEWAYDVPRVEIEGPSWLREVWFDVQAKTGHAATETELRLMLRKLLADRFGLKLYKESRVMPAYALALTKDGPKFQEAATDGSFVMEGTNSLMLLAHHARMTDLAEGIGDQIGRPVVDQTGLTGQYEIRLNLGPYVTKMARDENGNPVQVDMMSLLFTGLQEELGLKLESKKLPVDILVIDHAENSPTEN